MVAPNKQSEDWSAFLLPKVFCKITKSFELRRYFQRIKICFVSQALEIATAQDHIDLNRVLALPLLKLLVNSVKLAVQATNLSDNH